MNHMCTSITLWEIPKNPLQGSEDGGPVPGCVMCGLNVAKLWIIVDTPESRADESHVYQYHTPGNSGEPTPGE